MNIMALAAGSAADTLSRAMIASRSSPPADEAERPESERPLDDAAFCGAGGFISMSTVSASAIFLTPSA